MKYYRYGKFRPSDYWESWVAIAGLLMFSSVSLILKSSFFFVLFPAIYAVIWLWTIIAPNCERFAMCDESITTFLGKRTRTILLPSELTLVVSYADICPPFAKRTAVGNQTHVLKDKCAISILQKAPLNVVLESLHQNQARKYTTSMIQTVFDDYRYIYSFVCEQSLFEKLITSRECQLIIPESLLEAISVDSSIVNVHIDMGY